MTWKARIAVPTSVPRGEIVEIKTLIAHPMESGYRRDHVGKAIPRNIIEQFTCTLDGQVVFRAELFAAIAANPYLSFFVRIDKAAELVFNWRDQHGQEMREVRSIGIQ